MKNFGGMKKETKFADVDLTSSVCVSFNRSRSTTNENAHRSHVIVLISNREHVPYRVIETRASIKILINFYTVFFSSNTIFSWHFFTPYYNYKCYYKDMIRKKYHLKKYLSQKVPPQKVPLSKSTTSKSTTSKSTTSKSTTSKSISQKVPPQKVPPLKMLDFYSLICYLKWCVKKVCFLSNRKVCWITHIGS